MSSFEEKELELLKNNYKNIWVSYLPPCDVNIAVITNNSHPYSPISLYDHLSISLGSHGVSEFVATILTFHGTVLEMFEQIKNEIVSQNMLPPIYAATNDEILNRNIEYFFPSKEKIEPMSSYSDEVFEICQINNENYKTKGISPSEQKYLNLLKSIGFMCLAIPEDVHREREAKWSDELKTRDLEQRSLEDFIEISPNGSAIEDPRFMKKQIRADEFDYDKCAESNLEQYYDGKEVVTEFFALFNQELLRLNPKAIKFIPFYTFNADLYQTEKDNFYKFIETYRSIDTNLFYLPFFKMTRYSFSYYLSQNLKSGDDYYSLLRVAFDRLMKRHKEEEFKRSIR